MARLTRDFSAALVALGVLGCGASDGGEPAELTAGGQTGSAHCDDNPPDCVCDVIGGTAIVRGVVREATADQVTVGVTEVYATRDPAIAAGVTVGGSFIVGQPCGLGDLAPPELGLDVFVAFEAVSAGDGSLLDGWLQLMPFEDPLPITQHLPLSSEDFAVLLDDAACRDHFSSPEPFLCEDDP